MTIARGVGLLAISVLVLAGCDRAAEKQATQGHYDPRRAFAPLTLPTPVNSYRAGDGAPGPDYWQNRADYKTAATLDPEKETLTGDETYTYTNISPTALTSPWVPLYENIYKKDARARYVACSCR